MIAFLQSANSRNESCHTTQCSSGRAWNCQITVSNPGLVTGLQQRNLPPPPPSLQPHSADLHQSYTHISSTSERESHRYDQKMWHDILRRIQTPSQLQSTVSRKKQSFSNQAQILSIQGRGAYDSKKITIDCCIRRRQSQLSAESLYPVGELLMAAGQPLLSLFSCPIQCVSEKHNQGRPQGTGEAQICYRRRDP